MLESQRRELMDAMGVKILHPRFQFVGAKPSLVLPPEHFINTIPVPVEVQAQAVRHEIQSSNEPTVTIITNQNTPKLDIDFSIAKKSIAKNSIESIKNTLGIVDKPQANSLKFRHRSIRVGELLMLLDQPTLEWHDEQEVKQFFNEIYFALTNKKFEYWSEAQFDWPPSKQFPFANDKNMAQQSVHSFMQEQMHPPCKYIILWGENVVAHTLEETTNVGDVVFLNDIPVLVLNTYQHYWQAPASKNLLWQHLQNVKKRIIANA